MSDKWQLLPNLHREVMKNLDFLEVTLKQFRGTLNDVVVVL